MICVHYVFTVSRYYYIRCSCKARIAAKQCRVLHKRALGTQKLQDACLVSSVRMHTLATSCAPRTSEKDASLAAVLTEQDPGLSPEKSAKSTLCTPTLPIIRKTNKNVHLRRLITTYGPRHSKLEQARARRTCLDAALLCSRALVGMREAARAAWVAMARCCRMPRDGSQTEPNRAVVLRIYVLPTCLPAGASWPRRRRREPVITACACGLGAAGG